MTKEEKKKKDALEKEGVANKNHIKDLIEDIFDHYSDYTDSERNKIKTELKHLESVNSILEKYDTPKQNEKRRGLFGLLSS